MKDSTLVSFGYIPDSVDTRDYTFKTSITNSSTINAVDLSNGCLPVRDQGSLGACTAFATTALVEFVRQKQKLISWQSSPLFTYYASRQLMNTVDSDSGATVRDALKSTANYGVAKEDNWPYNISIFTVAPPASAYEEALKHQSLVYYRIIPTKDNLLGCLAEGYPFTFGVRLYESFVKTQLGMFVYNRLPMPDTTKEKVVGAHCMLAVGFFTEGEQTYIKVRNSWGTRVGLEGHHYMPLEYFLDPNLAIDFWTIRQEEYTPDELQPDPTPTPTPTALPDPTPTPTPTALPDPTPTPTPTETPVVVPLDPVVPDQQSKWKTPFPYLIILFGISILVFLFYKN